VTCAETAELIDLPFGFNRIRHIAPMYTVSIVFARCRQRTRLHSCRELCKNGGMDRLGCGLKWAEGSTSSTIFARWR